MSVFTRLGRMIAIALGVALVFFVGRGLWANGLFSSVEPDFSGVCKALPGIAGIQDIEIANGMAFVAVGSARGPGPADGIYAMALSGGPLSKLKGAPDDFHPRGISLSRSPDGSGLFLLAVNRRGNGRASIDSFEVTNPATAPVLVAQGTISGGLLTDPQDVVSAGPGTFYVSNGSSGRPSLVRRLAGYGVMPASSILYFNGMSFRTVVEDMYGARGLLMTPDGGHMLVASLTGRAVRSFNREGFNGNLSEGESLSLPAAPEKLTLDSRGEVWAAAHASLFQWRDLAADPAKRAPSQVFRISLSGGAPKNAEQVYANDGNPLAGAGVAASAGKRLLIGSSLDGKLLDCTTN